MVAQVIDLLARKWELTDATAPIEPPRDLLAEINKAIADYNRSLTTPASTNHLVLVKKD